jgi:hypothetical protein
MDGPTTHLNIRMSGDPLQYVKMTTGQMDQVAEPYRYRVLVPWLAHMLPLPPLAALRLITYLCLFLSYLIGLATCRRLGLSLPTATVGLFATFACTYHLYNYTNPFLTDGAGLLALFVMVFALLANAYLPFLLAMCGGLLARENVIFLAPVWLTTRQWRSASLAMGVAGLVFWLSHHLLALPSSKGLFTYALQSYTLVMSQYTTLQRLIGFIFSWGYLWLGLLLGLLLMPRAVFARVSWATLLLLLGGIIACLFANYIQRMFSILAPIMVIACAYWAHALARRHGALLVVFVGIAALQVVFGIPTHIAPWAFTFPYISHGIQIIGMLFLLCAAYLLRQELITACREKWGTRSSLPETVDLSPR